MEEIRESVTSADPASRKELEVEYKKQLKELHKKAGIKQWKQFTPILAAPFFTLNILSLREMVSRPEFDFEHGVFICDSIVKLHPNSPSYSYSYSTQVDCNGFKT